MTLKERTALISLVASLALAGAKLAVGLMIGSLALVTDAFHSGTDFLATAVTFVAVRYADRPPDETHPYGHGKFENVAALFEAALLLVLAGFVTAEAVGRLGDGAPPPELGVIAFAVLGVEIVINAWRARALHKVAKETGSHALAADALHFASDILSSIAVLGGFMATLAGYDWGDPVAAIAVAVLIAILALKLLKGTVDQLTDAVPRGLVKGLTRIVDDIPGVVDVAAIRVRTVGADNFVDVEIGVPRIFTVDEVAALKQRVRAAVTEDLGRAGVVVETRPVAVDDETAREQVLVAAARVGIPVHHITLHRLGDRLSVSLDIEVDGTRPLGEAHDDASRVEEAIRAEIGADIEVETHLEPLFPDLIPGAAVDGATAAEIAGELTLRAGDFGVTDVHNVRVRALGEGLFVAFHCRFDAATPTAAVHASLDGLERTVRRKWPAVLRIVSHPEPIRA